MQPYLMVVSNIATSVPNVLTNAERCCFNISMRTVYDDGT